MTTAAKKPRASRAEHTYREEIEAAHMVLDGASVPAGHLLAERISLLVERLNEETQSLEAVTYQRDAVRIVLNSANATTEKFGEALRAAERTIADHSARLLGRDSRIVRLEADLKSAIENADRSGELLEAISNALGLDGGHHADLARRALILRNTAERHADLSTVIACLALAFTIQVDGSKPGELIELARDAAKAARGAS